MRRSLGLFTGVMISCGLMTVPFVVCVSCRGEQQQSSQDSRGTDSLPREIVNSVGMRLALIRAGEFRMGLTDPDRDASPDEMPQHPVRISQPFYMGVYEVTQGEYERVTGTNPSWFSPTGPGRAEMQIEDAGRHPLDMVSWFEAVEFCKRLSELPEERAAHRTYRLPTEAEWEYACRAGTDTLFSTGDLLTPADACFQISTAEKREKIPVKTTPVGSYRANRFGLYDMHGNVWEWCADWYSPDAYRASPEVDPAGPAMGTGKVIRGGAWNFGAAYCRSANRDLTRASRRDLGNGFR